MINVKACIVMIISYIDSGQQRKEKNSWKFGFCLRLEIAHTKGVSSRFYALHTIGDPATRIRWES
jgi:hypothetical protein